MKPLRAILVPVDFSPSSDAAVAFALELAKVFGATLHLLHSYEAPLLEMTPYQFAVPQSVWDEVRDASRQRLEAEREKLAAEGVAVEIHLEHGLPSEAIAEAASRLGVDLIAMGTRGHTRVKHLFLGSVAERTLRTAPCPVLTVKAPRD